MFVTIHQICRDGQMVYRDWQNFISKHASLISGGVALLRLERKGVLILPAYGTFTGGLRTQSETLRNLMRPEAVAILTGKQARPIPMPRD